MPPSVTTAIGRAVGERLGQLRGTPLLVALEVGDDPAGDRRRPDPGRAGPAGGCPRRRRCRRRRAPSRSRAEASPMLPSGAPTRTSRPALMILRLSAWSRMFRTSRERNVAAAPWLTRAALAAYDRGVTSLATTDDRRSTTATGRASRSRPSADRSRRSYGAGSRPTMPDGSRCSPGSARGRGRDRRRAAAVVEPRRSPPGKIFDEIYYATEGHDLFKHGVEWNATSNTGDFVVHPPLGKWIIGVGEWIFEYNEFGWRIMPAVFGTLAILMLIRITRRLFRSTVLGLRRRPADDARRHGVRAVPHRAAGHLPDVLHPGRVRLPGDGPRRAAPPLAARDGGRARPDATRAGPAGRETPLASSRSRGGGWPPR